MTLLAFYYQPISSNIFEFNSLDFSIFQIFGIWLSLIVSLTFIGIYCFRIADESRKVEGALKETQLALSDEEKVSDIMSLTAAAVHELGTPLSTISVIIKEIANDLSKDEKNLAAFYNSGNASYMSGDFESARESFNSFISKTNNIDDKSKAHYNIGNSFLTEYAKEAKEKGQAPSSNILKNAIKEYQQSLRFNPNDKDARYNLSYAMKLLQNQEKQEQEKKDQNKEQEDKENQENKDQDNKEKKDQDQKEKDKEKQDQKKKEDKDKENKQDQGNKKQEEKEKIKRHFGANITSYCSRDSRNYDFNRYYYCRRTFYICFT